MTRPRKRPALGADVLSSILGTPTEVPPEPAEEAPPQPQRAPAARLKRRPSKRAKPAAARTPSTKAGPDPEGGRRPRATAQGYVDPEVLSRARDAVYWTPGLSLSGLIERGLISEIRRLEKERGEPFPPRLGELTPGPSVR